MITKRSRMPIRQENPKTFAINNSKGMDESKSPIDASTVHRLTNLTVNADGSVSPREPIVSVNLATDPCLSDTARIEYLHDRKYRLYITKKGSAFIVDDSGKVCAGRVYVTDSQYVFNGSDGYAFLNDINFADAEVTPLGTTTVISNVKVSYYSLLAGDSNWGNYDAILREELYDDNKAAVPRYLQLYYSEDIGAWRLDVQTPEVNHLNIADGEIMLNPNMTLDNPYAIRDGYGSAIPVVRGILAYAPSKLENGVPVYSQEDATGVRKAATAYELYGKTSTVLTVNAGPDSKDVALSMALEILSVTPDTGAKHYAVKWKAEFTVTNPAVDTSYPVQIEFNIRASNPTLAVTSEYEKLEFSESMGSGSTKVLTGTCYIPSDNPATHPSTDFKMSGAVVSTIEGAKTRLLARTVAELTESAKSSRYRILSTVKRNHISDVVLKAFCDMPREFNGTVYATWLRSRDGVDWEVCGNVDSFGSIAVREPAYLYNTVQPLDKAPDVVTDYVTHTYVPFSGVYQLDKILPDTFGESKYYGRSDVLILDGKAYDDTVQYMFKVVAVEPISESDPEYGEGVSDKQYRTVAEYGRAIHIPTFGERTEFLYSDLDNASFGKKLYHKRSLYSYGHEKFKNNIFVSAIDSFETPLYNIIDLDAVMASKVTCLLPWRDYLISATENAIYLHSKQSEGYLTKTLTTSVGVSEEDARCCKAILNGIILKAGSKMYFMYPNLYSGEDTSLSLTDISQPVEEFLLEHAKDECFAFATNSEYILVFKGSDNTSEVLRYDLTYRTWLTGHYNVKFDDAITLSVDDIRIFGTCKVNSAEMYGEYRFDAPYSEGMSADGTRYDTYGDILVGDMYGRPVPTQVPIEFSLDSGQKTDNIAYQHQFVESRMVFATGDEFEYFPLEAIVSVDGDPRETRIDVNSDAAFWKDDFNTKGVASTSIRMTSTDPDRSVKGILRQLILRYNVKGRSIRHVIRGKATRPFKLYETYVKYKPTNK